MTSWSPPSTGTALCSTSSPTPSPSNGRSRSPDGSALFPGQADGLRPVLVAHRAHPALHLRPAPGDEDRGGLSPHVEAVPGVVAAVPEHAERDSVAGHEVPGVVVVALGPEADH